MTQPHTLQSGQLASIVNSGDRIYIPGGSAPPVGFLDAIQQDPAHSRELHLVTSIAPGINNPIDPDKLHDSARITGLFMQPGLRKAQRRGQFRLLPVSYGGFVRHLRECLPFDLCVLQVSPPDDTGHCCLGPTVEFTPLALERSKRCLALINPSLPSIPGGVKLPLNRFDTICEYPAEVPVYSTGDDAPTRAIAQYIANQIDDGSTLQMGLGKVPVALSRALCSHRRLRLHTGLLSDAAMTLSAAGALDTSHPATACVIAGSPEFYTWAEQTNAEQLRLFGCETTHSPASVAALPRFVAVNSALEVDLFGQCNLEHAGGRSVSGAGGAPDFARAARLSPGGISIVALNSVAQQGAVSRIVTRLTAPGVASLSRVDVDLVITEHGVADLRGLGVHERAEALIAIADPAFRAELQAFWSEIAQQL